MTYILNDSSLVHKEVRAMALFFFVVESSQVTWAARLTGGLCSPSLLPPDATVPQRPAFVGLATLGSPSTLK